MWCKRQYVLQQYGDYATRSVNRWRYWNECEPISCLHNRNVAVFAVFYFVMKFLFGGQPEIKCLLEYCYERLRIWHCFNGLSNKIPTYISTAIMVAHFICNVLLLSGLSCQVVIKLTQYRDKIIGQFQNNPKCLQTLTSNILEKFSKTFCLEHTLRSCNFPKIYFEIIWIPKK